jgi:hypothetical protein
MPDNEPIVAVARTVLDQIPPGEASDSAAEEPIQTAEGPPIDAGSGLTVTAIVR